MIMKLVLQNFAKAVAEGLFYDFAEATAMVKLYNKDMLQDVDYEIELIE